MHHIAILEPILLFDSHIFFLFCFLKFNSFRLILGRLFRMYDFFFKCSSIIKLICNSHLRDFCFKRDFPIVFILFLCYAIRTHGDFFSFSCTHTVSLILCTLLEKLIWVECKSASIWICSPLFYVFISI